MKVAIPTWLGRVSPVFDVAAHVLVVEAGESGAVGREGWTFDTEDPSARAVRLVETGAEVLICGAISLPMERAVASRGIRVISQVCGDVDEVLQAFFTDGLQKETFLMPGCCGRRRRRRGRRGHGRGRRQPTGGRHGRLNAKEY
jgi:predicted Fe-Mo cluster-binding NifX family protein